MASMAWGKAKREVLALKPEIVALIKNGATLVEIYKILYAAGRLTVGESTFFRHAAVIRDESLREAQPPRPPVELTPEVLAWIASVPKPAQATHPQQSSPQEPAAAVQVAVRPDSSAGQATARSTAAGSPRLPVGAGKEPEVPKFKGLKSGGDHW